VIEQLAGCGTSVGANLCEADEAMSRPDFVKTLCIVVKELNETRYWLRLIGRRDWIKQTRLLPLQQEADELKRICGAIISRTRQNAKRKSLSTPTA
jgi:four helix bundle protein